VANTASEKLLISGLARYPDSFFEYIQYLDVDDFSHQKTRMTFESMRSLFLEKEAEKISKAKLVSEAKALGHGNYLSVIDDGKWLDEVLSEVVTIQEIGQHFLEVKRQSLIKKYMQASQDVRDYLRNTSDSLSDIISKVEDTVVSKVTMLDRGERAIKYLTEDARKRIESLAKDPGHVGLDIGYPIWQSRVGQIRNGSITFVVGTTGSGKSQFGLRAALTTAHKLHLPVLILDSELNENDQLVRLVAMLAKIPYEIIETGYWTLTESELRAEGVTDQAELDRIKEYKNRLQDDRYWQIVESLPIEYMSISGMGVKEVIPHIRRWLLTKVKPTKEAKHPQCLIVYDYIKLATVDEISGGRIAEWQMHGLNVAALHDLVTRYNVPCMAFGQTNNEIDEGIKCVAGGKRISENVTSVSYFKRKNDDERAFDSNGSHLSRIFKARYGRGTPNAYINFDVDLSFGEFRELAVGTVNFNEERRRRMQQQRNAASRRGGDDDDDET
jgi:replicative DNA helicase